MRHDWLAFVKNVGGKVALLRQVFTREALRALISPEATSSRMRFLELRLGVDRADVGVLVERIADAERLHAIAELADDDVVHALLDEEAEPAQHTWPWLK